MTETYFSQIFLNRPNLLPETFSVPFSFSMIGRIEYPELLFNHAWFHFLLILVLVLFNGFFVAAEVALVKLRSAQLEGADFDQEDSIDLTRKILGRLDRYIPACKFGSSIAGVLLGAISVPFLIKQLVPLVGAVGFNSVNIDLAVSFVIAVGIVLALLVVLGKVIPNSIGFRREIQVSMRISRPLYWFFQVFGLPILALTALSNFFMSRILRIEPASEREPERSAEDLKMYLEESGEDAVTATEKEILINVLELNDLKVRDIVTPRSEVVALDINDAFEENLEKAVGSKHTRFPLIDEHLDETLGQIHIKDLIQMMQQPEKPNLKKVKRNILRVNEELELDSLLRTFVSENAHIALVNDEYGGSSGIVMLDDLLELLVGDIQDEFEEEEEDPVEIISEHEYVVAANLPLHELDDVVPELDLESEEVSTVGGYVTEVLGHLPKVGEVAQIAGFNVQVTDADEKKVNEVVFKRIVDDLLIDPIRGGEATEGKKEKKLAAS